MHKIVIGKQPPPPFHKKKKTSNLHEAFKKNYNIKKKVIFDKRKKLTVLDLINKSFC